MQRLDEEGKGRELRIRQCPRLGNDGEVGRGQPRPLPDPLRHSLVQAEDQRQGIRAGVEDAVGLQQGRDLGLPGAPPATLRHVEDESHALALQQETQERLEVADAPDLVSETGDGPLEIADALLRVEFGTGIGRGVGTRSLLLCQIEGQSELHQKSRPSRTLERRWRRFRRQLKRLLS